MELLRKYLSAINKAHVDNTIKLEGLIASFDHPTVARSSAVQMGDKLLHCKHHPSLKSALSTSNSRSY